METKRTEKIDLILDDATNAGFAFKTIPSKTERRKKGWKAGLPFWLAAIPFAFVPLLHFIIVPVLVVIGFVLARSYWKGRTILHDGKVICPRCRKNLEFNDVPEEKPLKILCDSCGFQLRLYEAAP